MSESSCVEVNRKRNTEDILKQRSQYSGPKSHVYIAYSIIRSFMTVCHQEQQQPMIDSKEDEMPRLGLIRGRGRCRGDLERRVISKVGARIRSSCQIGKQTQAALQPR